LEGFIPGASLEMKALHSRRSLTEDPAAFAVAHGRREPWRSRYPPLLPSRFPLALLTNTISHSLFKAAVAPH